MPSEILRCLLANLVDYAGLFPPADLDMGTAAKEYARQRALDEAWMLGRFVVPWSRLDELEGAAERYWRSGGGIPWRLSVLAPSEISDARRRIDTFQRDRAAPGHAAVEAVETKASQPAGVAPRVEAFGGFAVYVEIPHREDPAPFLAALAEHCGRAKIRTGGVTTDAVPTSAELARFIVAAAGAAVPFKATAGLHHPLRGEHRLTYEESSPSGTLHGFLNVFLAAAWAKTGGMGSEEVEALLEERDPGAFDFSEGVVRWRDKELDAASIVGSRMGFASSFGSCSFTEPVADLKSLALL